jgi:iron complex outermembrane receptor protein
MSLRHNAGRPRAGRAPAVAVFPFLIFVSLAGASAALPAAFAAATEVPVPPGTPPGDTGTPPPDDAATTPAPEALPDGIIAGSLADPSGIPIPGALVTLAGPAIGTRRTTTDAAGRFFFAALPPGDYVVTAVAPGFETASRGVALPAAGRASIDLRVAAGRFVQSIRVTARRPGEDPLDSPGGAAVVPRAAIERSLAHNLKDVLALTPGVLVQTRHGADESQVSIRGSGLRNNFHLRGTNVLVNGIPYGDADGFTDFEALDLAAAERVEIWKGANALRWGGNSSGGAIHVVTPDGASAPPLRAQAYGGAFGLARAGLASGGRHGGFGHFFSVSRNTLDGYREHSSQDRTRLSGNLAWTPGERTALRLDLMYADVSERLPGALTRAEFDADPTRADPTNVTNDWGRFYDFYRLGFGVRRALADGGTVEATVYGQYRDMDHPIFLILDQDARSVGAEIRWRAGGAGTVAGLSVQYGDVDERRFVNLSGERGPLARKFGTGAVNYGAYVEHRVPLGAALTLVAAGRADYAVRRYDDRILADGDRSDRRTYGAVSPKIGLLRRAGPIDIFGNLSRSYEPPLLLELASFGSTDGFIDLRPQDTRQAEVGTRGRLGDRLAWDAAVYHAEVRNEILNRNEPAFGTTIPTYWNADRTRHQGLELGLTLRLGRGLFSEGDTLTWRSAYTLSRFRFVDHPDYGDNRIPGAPGHLARIELAYEHPRGFWIAPALDWSPRPYFVDSANSARNDAWAATGLRAGWRVGAWDLFVEGANLGDRVYASAVQVDSATGRFYEPANGRALYAGVRWSPGGREDGLSGRW